VDADLESPTDEAGRWYRYSESYGVVIALIGGTLWGLAAKPGNSVTLLGSTIVIACVGAALFLVGLTAHLVAHLRRRKSARVQSA
jgi:hypothetical protein